VRVIVTGVPASGKTTTATDLARELGVAYVSKDVIKEALWDALGPGDVGWSQKLGAAAARALLDVARASDHIVIDHVVRRAFADEWAALPDLVEVHCTSPVDVIRARWTSRHRPPCHMDADRIGDLEAFIADDAQASPIGPRLDVDTSGAVDIVAIAEWIRAQS
jgi:predicted kinase